MAEKGFDLAGVLGDVSKLDTGREQIEYFDIDRIDDDPNNFYEITGIDELAANIQLCGLQQPIRVRDGENGRVTIVSGHRRRAALAQLVKDGLAQYREVPCIRERAPASDALRELQLIYANSDSRKMTSAEISKQAERVEMLLYQLKEEGVEFPGRMRDHVAEACKVSKSKLARLKVIRENLIPQLKTQHDKNKLNESVAYLLAQQTSEVQKLVCKYKGKRDSQYWSEWSTQEDINKIVKVTSRGCPKKKGEMCSHCDAILGKLFDGSYSYKPCDNHCCAKCEKLGTCKSACPLLADKAKQLKTDAKAESRQAAEAKAEHDRPQIERIASYWKRFGEARALSGKTIKNWFKHCEMYYGDKSEAEYLQNEQGEKIKTDTTLPYGYNYFLNAAEKLRKAADYLGVSADYLLCRTDDPGNGKKQAQAEVSSDVWRIDADYPESKWLIVLFQLDKKAKPIKRFVYVVGKRLYFSDDLKTKVDMTPIAWMVSRNTREKEVPSMRLSRRLGRANRMACRGLGRKGQKNTRASRCPGIFDAGLPAADIYAILFVSENQIVNVAQIQFSHFSPSSINLREWVPPLIGAAVPQKLR